MQVFGPYRVSTPQPASVSRSTSTPMNSGVAKASQPVDELDLSPEAQRIEQSAAMQNSPAIDGIRFEKVAEIRQQIADGSYETDEKLDMALERLLDQVG